MKKKFVILCLILVVNLVGCGSQSNSQNSDNNNSANSNQITVNNDSNSSIGGSTTSNLNKDNFKKSYNQISLKDSAVYVSLFQVNGTELIFPNWDDNNNISIINEPYPKDIINTSNVSDFFKYPTNSLTIINNIVYFADADNNNSLGSINLSNRGYNPILPTGKISNLIGQNNIIYFLDENSNNKLHAFDTSNNSDKVISNDNVGKYLIDDNIILYENKSDNSTLYSINIDGTNKQKLTNFSVNSFAPYSGQILAINSSDNNNLYSINLNNLEEKRLAIMNGEDLKIFNGTLYFINVSNNRHLSTMTIDLNQTTPTVNFKDISDYAINEYYPNTAGIFAQKGVNVNNGYVYIK